MLQSSLFNSSGGYLDALFRINKSRIITKEKLEAVTECNSLEDFRLFLSSYSDEYGKVLENVPKLQPTAIFSKCMQVMYEELQYLLVQNNQPQVRELVNYFRTPFMIDNASLLLRYSLTHEASLPGPSDQQTVLDFELGEEASGENAADGILEKCHPLGLFDSLCMLRGPQSVFKDVYYEILLESPLQPYLVAEQSLFDKLESVQKIELFINVLYRRYLDDFYSYCQVNLSGYAQEKMLEYVRLEADLRNLNVTINSLHSQNILPTDKLAMYAIPASSFSLPCLEALAAAISVDQIKQHVLAECPQYSELFISSVGIDDWFIGKELQALEQVFIDSFTNAVFFAYFKLKEQEIKNLYWIAECIAQQQPKELYRKHVI